MLAAVLAATCPSAAQGPAYFPAPGDAWMTKPPAEVGFDPDRLDKAVRHVIENETSVPNDLEKMLEDRFRGLPDQEIVGPMKPRGAPNRLVLRHGFIVAEWGDTRRVDMTFSVTKSYLATLAGLA